jgi:PPK2 family polyphosphate:nucleotide phosphotransferase
MTANNKRLEKLLAPHRHASPKAKFVLADFDPSAKPFSSGDKVQDKLAVDQLAIELDALQDKLFADRRYKVLVILQGVDTSGKDGTLRAVFSRMTPLGVHAIGWKAPNDVERAHDPWWRIHRQVPAAGEITVFNRSHYEDVLVPVVHGDITKAQAEQRYAHINDFERMLTETGTIICKFMLHLSKDEQRERLQARVDDPNKHWKFNAEDLEVRKHWDAYQDAYAAAIAATGTPWAPWIVVPANSKTHRNLMIASVVKQQLEQLGLRYPPSNPELMGLRIE